MFETIKFNGNINSSKGKPNEFYITTKASPSTNSTSKTFELINVYSLEDVFYMLDYIFEHNKYPFELYIKWRGIFEHMKVSQTNIIYEYTTEEFTENNDDFVIIYTYEDSKFVKQHFENIITKHRNSEFDRLICISSVKCIVNI